MLMNMFTIHVYTLSSYIRIHAFTLMYTYVNGTHVDTNGLVYNGRVIADVHALQYMCTRVNGNRVFTYMSSPRMVWVRDPNRTRFRSSFWLTVCV